MRGEICLNKRGSTRLRNSLQDYMCICSPEAEGTDSCECGVLARRPGGQRCLNAEGEFCKGDIRVGLAEMKAWRYLTVLERQRDLDESCDTSRRFQVPDIG